MGKIKERLRLGCQLAFTALSNGYARGFGEGKIFTGPTKHVCVPGLNCYSCPGALGSCPIGALQAVIGSRKFQIPFYVLGFLMMIGALCGRLVCGWLCPFGLVQDLLYKIPGVKKLRKLPGDRFLRWIKYGILAVFVVLLPLFVVDIVGQGSPWFCKYICPSGTLFGGIPLVSANESLRSAIGWLYTWKVAILVVLLVLSVFVCRPFCRYLCPLGAIYGPFNKFALFRYRLEKDKCVSCGKYQKTCPMDLPVWEKPNSAECIRCGRCRSACPTGAIRTTVERRKKRESQSSSAG